MLFFRIRQGFHFFFCFMKQFVKHLQHFNPIYLRHYLYFCSVKNKNNK